VDLPALSRREKPLKPEHKLVLAAVNAVSSNGHGQKAPAGVPCGANTYAVPLKEVRDHAYKIGLSREGESKSGPRMRFNRAVEFLCSAHKLGKFETETGEAWLWTIPSL
jgi:hypothetical protein